MNDERERSIQQTARLMEIRREQEAIRKELAEQTVFLSAIRDEQRAILAATKHGADKIEDGQRWLAREVRQALVPIAIQVGVMSERNR